jgi:hypothetical protein
MGKSALTSTVAFASLIGVADTTTSTTASTLATFASALTTTLHACLLGIFALLASDGLVSESLLGVKGLLSGSEDEAVSAVTALKGLISLLSPSFLDGLLNGSGLGVNLQLNLFLLLGLGIRRIGSRIRGVRLRLHLLLLGLLASVLHLVLSCLFSSRHFICYISI